MHEEKFLELILCKLQSAVLNVFSFIEFSFSQKVVFSYFLWYMAYLSSWKLGVDIIAGISTLLIFYLREIQKEPSNISEILKAWLGKNIGGAS